MIKKRIIWLMKRVTPKMLKDGIPPNLETRFDDYFKLEERFDKMEKLQLSKYSKKLSYLLRHNPEDLEMDKNGWVKIDDILNKLNISILELEKIVDTNDKKRFSFDETLTYIRANQGHSLDVDVELKETKPPKYLYHGTSPNFIKDIIKSGGINKMSRQHVHLSHTEDTAYIVGKRHSKRLEPTIIKV